MIEIKPQTRVMFKTKKDRDEWAERFPRISKAYNRTELETFLQGDRDIYIIMYILIDLWNLISF